MKLLWWVKRKPKSHDRIDSLVTAVAGAVGACPNRSSANREHDLPKLIAREHARGRLGNLGHREDAVDGRA
jgi:hypothetical protein